MKELKVYIIQTTYKDEREGKGEKSLRGGSITISYLAALCPEYCEVKLCDELYQRVDYNFDADIVAISTLTSSANHSFEIAKRFKKEKGSWIVMGGSHASVCPDECLQYADSVCIGEAENTFPELIDSVYKTGKAKKKYWENNPVNLENLPFPRRELLDSDGVYLHGVQMTRGCQYSCDFCFIKNLYGKGVRVRPVDDVIKEISETINWDRLAFWDDNIIANRDHAYELFTKMIPLKKRWISQCCLDIADDDELLKQAAKSGCTGLFVGIESFNQNSLKKMKKSFNKAKTYKERIDKLHDHGIFLNCGINFGCDEDDPFVFERSLEAIDYVGLDVASATINTPMPGTFLTKRLLEEGRIFDFNWDHYDYRHVVFKPKKMTEEQLAEGHGWFYNEFYKLKRMSKRIMKNFWTLRMPLAYRIIINSSFKRVARTTARLGKNPAVNVIDGVEPPKIHHVDYKLWSDYSNK
jgi:radical SAM superfamily enzyme YgiQ (UPF0313 family)